MLKSANNLYFNNKIYNVRNYIKGTWNVIYDALGKTTKKINHFTEILDNEGNSLVDENEIANEFTIFC